MNEDIQLKAGKFNCIARVNITSKVFSLPKYILIPFNKMDERLKKWKTKKDNYIKKHPKKLKSCNRNIRVTVS